MVPENLRSGLGHPTFEDDKSPEIDSTCQRLIATVAVMSEMASAVAGTVAQHRRSNEVMVEDVNNALKMMAMHFLDDIDDELTNHILDMEAFIFRNGTAPSTKPIMDRVSIDNATPCGPPCQCMTCSKVHTSVQQWDTWDPTDEAKQFLKYSVQRSIDKVLSGLDGDSVDDDDEISEDDDGRSEDDDGSSEDA